MFSISRWTLVLALATSAGAVAAREEIAPIPPPPPMDTSAPERLPATPPPQDTLPPPPGDALPGGSIAPPDAGSAPQVNIRTEENGDTVEEYRTNGVITMVKVRPRVGVPYTMMDTNGDGRLDRRDANGAPVAPVYYTIYEWD